MLLITEQKYIFDQLRLTHESTVTEYVNKTSTDGLYIEIYLVSIYLPVTFSHSDNTTTMPYDQYLIRGGKMPSVLNSTMLVFLTLPSFSSAFSAIFSILNISGRIILRKP